MSTWHQQQAVVVPLWHVSKFTAVSDAPGRHTSIMDFNGIEAAKEYAEATGDYILYPKSGGRTT